MPSSEVSATRRRRSVSRPRLGRWERRNVFGQALRALEQLHHHEQISVFEDARVPWKLAEAILAAAAERGQHPGALAPGASGTRRRDPDVESDSCDRASGTEDLR